VPPCDGRRDISTTAVADIIHGGIRFPENLLDQILILAAAAGRAQRERAVAGAGVDV
jgi:hypothetical protein